MDDITTGWLTKSPGSKHVRLFSMGKVQINLPLRTKWRRRYFRLFQPKHALPNQFELSYYTDETLAKKLGSINLEDCDKIQASLDSAHYQNLFSIETTSKRHPKRSYYLAADSAEEMATWVESLCGICNLSTAGLEKPNNNFSAEPIHIDSDEEDYDTVNGIPRRVGDDELANEILHEIDEDSRNGNIPSDGQQLHGSSVRYTELSNCHSGSTPTSPIIEETVSNTQIDNSNTQPPKPTNHPSTSTNRDSSTDADDYDIPPTALEIKGFQHKTSTKPTPRPRNSTNPTSPTWKYKEGAGFRPDLHASSSSLNSKLSNAFSKNSQSSLNDSKENGRGQDIYDYVPPGRRPSQPSIVPEEYNQTPPRPPKPDHVTDHVTSRPTSSNSEQDYINASDLSNIQSYVDDIYDIPKSLTAALPPPSCLGPHTKVHKYINASTQLIDGNGEEGGHNLVDLNAHVKPSRESNPKTLPGYLPMDGKPPSKRDVYVPMTSPQSPSDIYDVVPQSRPVAPTAAPAAPHRPPKPRKLKESDSHDESTQLQTSSSSSSDPVRVSMSPRTKSYIRDSVFSDTAEDNDSYGQLMANQRILLPQTPARQSHSSSEDNSSDEEAAEQQDQIYDALPAPRKLNTLPAGQVKPQAVPRACIGSQAPAVPRACIGSQAPARPTKQIPGRKLSNPPANHKASTNEHSIQYVELDQSHQVIPDSIYSAPPRSTHINKGVDLQYVEIDMKKTQALSETRKERTLNLSMRKDSGK